MKFAAALLAFVAVASANVVSDEFLAYLKTYEKSYTDDELPIRAQIYADNVAKINAHNAGESSFKMGINQFTDMNEEHRKAFKGAYRDPTFEELKNVEIFNDVGDSVPDAWDWRSHGAVNPIQNQGSCGVCWAFGSSTAVESAYKIKSGKLVLLAPSQQVDCNSAGGCNECAFKWLQKNKGCSEESYHYICPDNDKKCHACTDVIPLLSGYKVVPVNQTALKIAVYHQPVSIGIAAADQFMGYHTGIFDGTCSGGRDHSVALVGYGSEGGKDFFILRNQWGTSWGENGYMRIIRGSGPGDGHCLLATDASFPEF